MIEEIAGKAWAFRHWVEHDARLRFARLARDLESMRTPPALIELGEQSSRDEDKHARHCAEQAARYDHALHPVPERETTIAPAKLSRPKQVLYEIAAVAVAETESTVMLLALRDEVKGHAMRSLLKEFAKDEVTHAKWAWAVLEAHRTKIDLSYLSRWIPWMLKTTVGDSFAPAKKGQEDPALIEHGVLPYTMRKKVFIDTLEDVVFPGLDKLSIDSGPSRKWLAESIR